MPWGHGLPYDWMVVVPGQVHDYVLFDTTQGMAVKAYGRQELCRNVFKHYKGEAAYPIRF